MAAVPPIGSSYVKLLAHNHAARRTSSGLTVGILTMLSIAAMRDDGRFRWTGLQSAVHDCSV
jgi:hypothetical protein